MIPKIKRILYATDLSENSAYAFGYAINSAKMHNAGIIILHVLERIPAYAQSVVHRQLGEESRMKILEESISSRIDRIKSRLQTFCELKLKDEPECLDKVESIEVCEGYPAEEILRKADELDCDAIVIGTHGKGVVSHAFLGSVAKRVLRRVRKPVFVIPLPKGEIELSFP